MSNQPSPGGNLSILNALLDLLELEGQSKVNNTITAFRELLKGMDPFSSFRLLRLKLKALVATRDQALMEVRATGAPPERDDQTLEQLNQPIQEMLDRTLDLLEGATHSTGNFSENLDRAIQQLKRAKDFVNLKQLSKHLLDTSTNMATATDAFQANIGEIAHTIMDYQYRIEELENEVSKQKKMATEDGLTRILNRAAFDHRFKELVTHAQRFKTPLCLFLVDMDHFKVINDTHGHQVGDDVLVNFAQLLKRSMGERSLVFRYGGDEFAVLFSNMKLGDARTLTERLQHFIKKNAYHYKDIKFNMNISGGLSCLDGGETRGNFFEKTDKLLYRAKEEGRGRICVA